MCDRLAVGLAVTLGLAAGARAADFQPDPRTVQRYGPAYRYPQAGWIVLHIEGQPYERGIQHGRLLAPEIAARVRCLAAHYGPSMPALAWKQMRKMVGLLFLSGYTKEQLEEMKGIADGASAAGARFQDLPLDLLDIAVINSDNELGSAENALAVTPNGLEGEHLTPDLVHPHRGPVSGVKRPERPMRCNAFAATAPATRDGTIVFGHITMWDLYPGSFYNVWLDIQPSKGHRMVMHSAPGAIYSGMEYTINDAGLLMSATAADPTHFDLQGLTEAARVREAAQYADSIEQAAAILTRRRSGLAPSDWILCDLKRNEIALLTLGTRHSKLRRSSQHEWIAGAEGFYWSCNNSQDQDVRLEGARGFLDRPSSVAAFAPSTRDTRWLALYDQYKGTIDADFARRALTMPGIVLAYSLDAKYTTSDLAGQLKTWATFGPPIGPSWQPTPAELRLFPEIHPLVCNPWVVLHPGAPKESPAPATPIVDLHDPAGTKLPSRPSDEPEPETSAAWHGTLLPKTDADIWLTTGFANYERYVAREKALRERLAGQELGPDELEALAVDLFEYRSNYELGARASHEVPLAQTRSNPRDYHWYLAASGKGVLLLHSLRGLVGAEVFDRLMVEFGRAHAGHEVTMAEFRAHFEKGTGRDLAEFFEPWLNRTGLPRLTLEAAPSQSSAGSWTTTATVARDPLGGSLAVPLTVETAAGEATGTARLERTQDSVTLDTKQAPVRVVADKYGLTARRNGGPFSILTFEPEVDHALIAYGTRDEEATNQEAAQVLQQALRRREHNVVAPIRRDCDVTPEELQSHHLLLIGRPACNLLVDRFRDVLPVTFGPCSFEARGAIYAHPESAVIVAAENPLNPRYSLVVIAGLGALATMRTVPLFQGEFLTEYAEVELEDAEVFILPHNLKPRALVMPPKELIRTLP
jgi:hypothetical protein